MVADILSQEEIDKLLNASGPAELSAKALGSVTGLVGPLFKTADATLEALVARKVKASVGKGEMVAPADIDTEASVLLRAPFRSGFVGELFIYLPASTAAVLSDLVLGGEGETKDALDDTDKKALKEAFGRLLTDAAPAIAEATGVKVAFGALTVKTVAQGALAGSVDNCESVYACKGSLKSAGVLDTPLFILFTAPTATNIVDTLALSGAAAERGAPQTARKRAPATAADSRAHEDMRNIDLIMDIEVEVMVRLGNAEMPLKDIQKLRPGSIIDLDKDTEALVELVVNNRVIARGELVVVSSDHFALRVTEIQTPKERIRSLGSS